MRRLNLCKIYSILRRQPQWLVFALPPLCFAWPLLTNSLPEFMDTLMQFHPWRVRAALMLRAGSPPLWNPYYFCGAPFLANPQTGFLYPGNWLFFLWPSGVCNMLTIILHISLAGLGGFYWSRLLYRRRDAGLITAAILMLGGYTFSRVAFGAYLQVWCWLPWLGWQTALAGRRKNLRPLFPCALILAAMLLGGAPQLAYYGLLFFFLLCLGNFLRQCAGSTSGGSSLLAAAELHGGLFLGSTMLAVLVSSPQLLSTFYFFKELERGTALSLAEISGGALRIADLPRALLGGTGGALRFEDAESSAYVGALALFLAAQALRDWKCGRTKIILACLVIFTLLTLSMFAGTFYRALPLYAYFHDPRRALGAAVVPLALLAGRGWLLLLNRRKIRETCIYSGIVLILLAACLPLLPAAPGALPFQPYRALGWIGVLPAVSNRDFVLLNLLLLSAALGWIYWRQRRSPQLRGANPATLVVALLAFDLVFNAVCFQDLKTARVRDLTLSPAAQQIADQHSARRWLTLDATANRNGFDYSYAYRRPEQPALRNWLPNLPMLHGIADFQGYDPAIPLRYKQYLALVNRGGRSLYAQHFGLAGDVMQPLLERAGVGMIAGDARYFHPLCPARLQPGANVGIPVRTTSRFDGIRIDLVFESGDGDSADFTSLLQSGAPLLAVKLVAPERGRKMFYLNPGAPVARSDFATTASAATYSTIEDGAGRAVGFSFQAQFKDIAPERSWHRLLAGAHGDPGAEFQIAHIELENMSGATMRMIKLGLARDAEFNAQWKLERMVDGLPFYSRRKQHATDWHQGFAAAPDEVFAVGQESEMWPLLAQIAGQPAAAVVVDPARRLPPAMKPSGRVTLAPAPDLPERRPGRFAFSVECEAAPRLITVAEARSAGWRATIDGQESPVLLCDGMFMGVLAPRGAHRVEFAYRPAEFTWTLPLSALTLLLMLIMHLRNRDR